MSKEQTIFRFTATLERFPGSGGWYFVRFPYSVEEHFGVKGAVRMKGLVNDIPVDRGLMPDGQGGHFIALGAELRRKAGLRLGDEVRCSLQRDEQPQVIELPEEFRIALELEPGAAAAFGRLRPGLRRSMVGWIASGKRAGTREQRSAEMLRRLMTGYFSKGERGGHA